MHAFRRGIAALPLAALLLCNSVASARAATAPAPIPPPTAADVVETFHLLATSAYNQIDPQAIVDGALHALDVEGQHRHVKLTLAKIRVDGPEDAFDVLDAEIERAAVALHETPTQAAYVALKGMASAANDKYTTFFTPDELKKFDEALDPQKISGIGIIIGPDSATGYVQAVYVVPGTPADRAGLRAGDDLTTIDGTSTKGLALDDITKILRGRTGTVVHVGVSRDGAAQPVLAITRAEIRPPTVVYRMLPGDVGYLEVFAFGQETPQEFDEALDKVRADGAKALVVDLRNNGGGYVRSAEEISSDFLSDRPIYTLEVRGEAPQVVRSTDARALTLPLAVLVNQYSASASEITAGALQDNGVATLVGAKTFGKGVMQTVTPLPDGSAIKITTAHYLTPANRDINLRGIEPDVSVDETKGSRFGDPDHDAQLRAALTVLEKKIAAVEKIGKN